MPKNKETLCFFVFLCFHKQTKQTLEVLSFMKLEQIIFVKEAVSFILRKQDILVKEVVSFLKKLLVSRKQDNVSPKLKTSIVGLFFMPVGSFPLN